MSWLNKSILYRFIAIQILYILYCFVELPLKNKTNFNFFQHPKIVLAMYIGFFILISFLNFNSTMEMIRFKKDIYYKINKGILFAKFFVIYIITNVITGILISFLMGFNVNIIGLIIYILTTLIVFVFFGYITIINSSIFNGIICNLINFFLLTVGYVLNYIFSGFSKYNFIYYNTLSFISDEVFFRMIFIYASIFTVVVLLLFKKKSDLIG